MSSAPSALGSTPRGAQLFSLPAELRLQIWTLLLQPLRRFICLSPRQPWVELNPYKTSQCPPILRVCRLVHDECAPLLYRASTFLLVVQPGFISQASWLKHRAHVRTVEIAVPLAEQHENEPSAPDRPTAAAADAARTPNPAQVYLPVAPERLVSQLLRIFPNVGDMALTLCAIPQTSVAYTPSLVDTPHYELRSLLLHPGWNNAITSVRYQLTVHMTTALFKAVEDGSSDRLNARLGGVADMPRLATVDFYFTTSLSNPPHEGGIVWRRLRNQFQLERTVLRYLARERTSMRQFRRVFPVADPDRPVVRLHRMLYWNRTISVEPVDLELPEREMLATLMQQRVMPARDDDDSAPEYLMQV